MMMKIIHPLLFSTLFFSSHSFATVGGPQNIEVLGLDQADQKIYVMRHYLDGRGRLPQLYYYQLNSKTPSKLIEVKSLYINPKTQKIDYDQNSQKFDRDIAKIKKRLKALTPIPPKQVKIQVISKKTSKEPSWYDPKISIPKFSYQYQVKYNNLKSPIHKAVDYKNGLRISQSYKVPNQQKALVTVQYLGIPFETGYNIEDPVLLMPKK